MSAQVNFRKTFPPVLSPVYHFFSILNHEHGGKNAKATGALDYTEFPV